MECNHSVYSFHAWVKLLNYCLVPSHTAFKKKSFTCIYFILFFFLCLFFSSVLSKNNIHLSFPTFSYLSFWHTYSYLSSQPWTWFFFCRCTAWTTQPRLEQFSVTASTHIISIFHHSIPTMKLWSFIIIKPTQNFRTFKKIFIVLKRSCSSKR